MASLQCLCGVPCMASQAKLTSLYPFGRTLAAVSEYSCFVLRFYVLGCNKRLCNILHKVRGRLFVQQPGTSRRARGSLGFSWQHILPLIQPNRT